MEVERRSQLDVGARVCGGCLRSEMDDAEAARRKSSETSLLTLNTNHVNENKLK
jgi:hypothetical protein